MMNKFPEVAVGDVLKSRMQLLLPIEDITEPPETRFASQRKIDSLDINVFRITHEHITKKVGRAKGIDFTSFVAIEHFSGYYKNDLKLMLLKANKDDAKRAMKHLSQERQDVSYLSLAEVDLDKIWKNVDGLSGAYFTVEDSANVQHAALWGREIDSDFRFDRAMNEGGMTFIRFNYTFMGEPFPVGVSTDYNVVIYDNHLDEHLEIELLLDIKARLLDSAQKSI